MYHHINIHADDGTQGWLQTFYVAEDGFELLIFLPQSPQCWNYKRAPANICSFDYNCTQAMVEMCGAGT